MNYILASTILPGVFNDFRQISSLKGIPDWSQPGICLQKRENCKKRLEGRKKIVAILQTSFISRVFFATFILTRNQNKSLKLRTNLTFPLNLDRFQRFFQTIQDWKLIVIITDRSHEVISEKKSGNSWTKQSSSGSQRS